MERLRLDDPMSEVQKQYALEAALLLGFQAESACFPIAGRDGEIPVPESEEALRALWTTPSCEVPGDDTPAQKQGPVFDLDFRKKQGLEMVFSKGFFLKDEDFDLFPDRLDVKLVLPEDADLSMWIAACNVAFRFGMETTAYTGTILASEGYTGNAVIFESAKQAEMILEETEEAVRVHIRGSGAELEAFSALLCGQLPECMREGSCGPR